MYHSVITTLKFCPFLEQNEFAWKEPGIGRNLTYFVATGILSLAILLVIEYRILNGLFYKLWSICQRRKGRQPDSGYLDVDVNNEKQKVAAMSSEEISKKNLILRGVSKNYGNILAVNELSIEIKE